MPLFSLVFTSKDLSTLRETPPNTTAPTIYLIWQSMSNNKDGSDAYNVTNAYLSDAERSSAYNLSYNVPFYAMLGVALPIWIIVSLACVGPRFMRWCLVPETLDPVERWRDVPPSQIAPLPRGASLVVDAEHQIGLVSSPTLCQHAGVGSNEVLCSVCHKVLTQRMPRFKVSGRKRSAICQVTR
jgi:hypothetical protein